jgi:TP901 family phage tail tape measure protein
MTEIGRVTAIIDGDISALRSKLAQARQESVAGVSGIERDLKGQMGAGLTGALSGGKWSSVGKTIGQDLVYGITAPLGAMGGVASGVATSLGPVGIAAVAGGAAVIGLGSASISAATEWEAGMARISKTTGIDQGTQAYADLSSQLKDLYATMPTTVAEIQDVAATAGSLGVEKDKIAGFTEVALQMGSAFEIPAGEAATAVGKIKSQLKTLPDEAKDSASFAQHFGSAVDVMGNSYNATEKDILDFSTRVSGSMSSLGAGAYEVAGWGGMLSSVFPSAERAAGSFDSLLTQLTTNTDSQSTAAELLGISTEDFMKAMSTDPSDTLLRISSALEGLPSEKLLQTTKTLGGAYGMDTLVKMVGHTEEYRTAIDDAVAAGQKGESIGASFERGTKGMEAQMRILKNSINSIFIDIGGPIIAGITPVVAGVAGALTQIRTAGEGVWEPLSSGIASVAGAFGILQGISLDGVVAGIEGIGQGIKVFERGKSIIAAFVSDLKNIVTSSSQFQDLVSAFQPIIDMFQTGGEASTGFSDAVSGAMETAMATIASGFETLAGFADALGLKDTAAQLRGVASDMRNTFKTTAKEGVAEGTKEGMESGAKGAQSSITTTVSDAIDEAYWSSALSRQRAGISQKEAYDIESYIKATGQPYVAAGGSDTSGSIQAEKYYRVLGHNLVWRAIGATEAHSAYQVMLDEAGNVLKSEEYTSLTDTTKSSFISAAVAGLTPAIGPVFLDLSEAIDDELVNAGAMVSSSIENNLFDANAIYAAAEKLKTLKILDPEEFAAQGGEAGLAWLNQFLYQLDKLDQAENKLKIHPDDDAARAEVQTLLGDVQTLLDNNPLTAKMDLDTTDFYAKLWEAKYAGQDLASLGVSDWSRAFKYQKEQLKSQMGSYYEQGMFPTPSTTGETGLYERLMQLKGVMEEHYNKLDKIDKKTLEHLQNIENGGKVGAAAWEEMVKQSGVLNDTLDSSTKKTNLLAEANKSLADSMEGCDCALSDFAETQEKAWDEMGLGGIGFIGNTQDYIEAMQAEYEAGRYHPAPVTVGHDYKAEMEQYLASVSGADATKYPIALDTSQADSDLEGLKTKATEEQQLPIKIDDSAAMASIAAIDAAASAPIMKPVYVQEIGGGGYGGGQNYLSSGEYSGIYNNISDFVASFAVGDIFVPKPTLAVVGDRPGGEYIGGLDQARARFGGGGGVTVNMPITIQGPIYGVDDLKGVLEANNRDLVQRIADAQYGF